jgi:hypothetical protein
LVIADPPTAVVSDWDAPEFDARNSFAQLVGDRDLERRRCLEQSNPVT